MLRVRFYTRLWRGKLSLLAVAMWLGFVSCSKEGPVGSISMRVIQPAAGHCQYSIAPARVDTLDSLAEMRGRVGRVLYIGENLGARPEILNLGEGLSPVDTQFGEGGGVYSPLDQSSLFAGSLYYSVETAYKLFARLDPSSDMAVVVPTLNQTGIIHDAKRTLGKVGVDKTVNDNAEYLGHEVSLPDGTKTTKDYLISFPTDKVKTLPLGLNLGIMVHEYTHLVFHHLFYEKAFALKMKATQKKPSLGTLRSMDEGNADYFGFMASQDPGFFHCSFDGSERDISIERSFTQELVDTFDDKKRFDPHELGAVWASIQYRIGLALGPGGFDRNGRALIRMMSQLLTCAVKDNTLDLDFGVAARCHAQAADSADQSTINSIYSKALGVYGGGT